MKLQDAEIASVDIEGNGRQPPEIVEIAVAHLRGVEIGRSRSWLLRPKSPITWQAKQIHGIGNKQLVDCPNFVEVQDEILKEIGGRYLLAHNASIEYTMLSRYFSDWIPLGVIDTLVLARHDRPDLRSHRLEAMIEEFNLQSTLKPIGPGPHRALFDALATAHIFRSLLLKRTIPIESIDDVLVSNMSKKDDNATGQQMSLI